MIWDPTLMASRNGSAISTKIYFFTHATQLKPTTSSFPRGRLCKNVGGVPMKMSQPLAGPLNWVSKSNAVLLQYFEEISKNCAATAF